MTRNLPEGAGLRAPAALSWDMADALLLDQQPSAARARTELGWAPTGPSLTEELETGSYAPH